MTTSTSNTLRGMNFFAGIYSQCIAIATQMKNNKSATPEIEMALDDFTVELLRKETTQSLFYAAGHLLSDRNLSELNKGDGRAQSLQDSLIIALSKIIINDVLGFTHVVVDANDDSAVTEGSTIEHRFTLIDKRYNKPAKKEFIEISDELRDEMSGANVEPGVGDNDCGDSCRI